MVRENINNLHILKEIKYKIEMIKSLADTFDVSQYKMKTVYKKRKEKVIKKDQQKDLFKQATKSDKNMNDILQGIQMQNKIPDFIKQIQAEFYKYHKNKKNQQ